MALMSYETMVANNMRGRGFKVLHLHGDLLWRAKKLQILVVMHVLCPSLFSPYREMGPMTAPTEAHLAAMPRNPFTVYDSVLPAPLPSSKFIKPTPPVTHRPDDPDENKVLHFQFLNSPYALVPFLFCIFNSYSLEFPFHSHSKPMHQIPFHFPIPMH